MSEILKTLWGRLYAWAFSSALVLGYYWLVVYPKAHALHGWLPTSLDSEAAVTFVSITGAIAIFLSSLSTQLYRILEGYLLWPRWLKERRVKRQLDIKRARASGIQPVQSGWLFGLQLEKFARYPLQDDQVVPTKFGNAIRSFETYGKTRFNLDSQTLWHELCSVSPKYIQTEINSAQSSVDFFVALFFLSGGFGFATIITALYENFDLSILALSTPLFLLMALSHWIAVRTIDAWAFAVQALVNIGRIKLADSLGLVLPETLEEEKAMWGLVTAYVFFARPEEGAKLDQFRKKKERIASHRQQTPHDEDELTASASDEEQESGDGDCA